MRAVLCGVALAAASCGGAVSGSPEPSSDGADGAGGKSDQGALDDVASANQFFLTQIRDERWNPDGVEVDTESNNCGPASLAMLMRARGRMPAGLTAEQATDHARALMHPEYPDIDADSLQPGATLDSAGGVLLLDDDSSRVFYDAVDDAPSAPHAIRNLGGAPTLGGDWAALDEMLSGGGMAIAYGFITPAWRSRLPGDYGEFGQGAIPHFVAIFAAADLSVPERYVVCDPMHHGGAVVMGRTELGAFFRSPVNVFDTSMRLLGWADEGTATPSR